MRPAALLTGLVLSLGALRSVHAQQPAPARTDAAPAGRIEIAELAHGAYVGSTLDLAAVIWIPGTSTTSNRTGIRWESSDVLTAWVTDEGTLTLFKPGTVTLTASHGVVTATKTIEILPNPARKLKLTGDAQAEVRVGTPIRLDSRVMGDEGQSIDDARVNYAVAAGDLLRNPKAAQITDDGIFTAAEPGVYTVIAEFGGVSDHLTMLIGRPGVSVEPAASDVRSVDIEGEDYQAFVGTVIPLSARVMRKGAKEPMTNPRLHWASSNEDVAWVAPNGVVVFEGPGRVTITATHGTKSSSRTFVVGRNPAAKLVLASSAREVYVNDTVKVKTDIWARGAELVRNPRVNYGVISRSPETQGAATVLENGFFVATRPGVYTVVAEFGGLADTRTVMVLPRAMVGRNARR
jgi:hypothetical protein